MLPAGAFQTRWGVLPPHVIFVYTPQGDSNIPTSIFALIRWVSAPSEALIRQETDQTKTKTTNEGRVSRGLLPDSSWGSETAARPKGHHCRSRPLPNTEGHRECGGQLLCAEPTPVG